MSEFTATHTVPAGGMDTWNQPDGALAPSNRLDGGLPVKLLRLQDDGWASVECSNGWTAWVDGRWLLPSAPPAPGPAAAPWGGAPPPPFQAPAAPAPQAPAAPGSFAPLLPTAAPWPPAPAAPFPFAAPAPPAQPPAAVAPAATVPAVQAPAAALGTGVYISLGGASLAALSAFLPWVSFNLFGSQVTISGFKMPLLFVLLGQKSGVNFVDSASALSIGLALLVAAGLAVVGVFVPRLGMVTRLAGLAVVLIPTGFLAQLQRIPNLGMNMTQLLGIGVWAAAIGGVLLLLGGGRKAA